VTSPRRVRRQGVAYGPVRPFLRHEDEGGLAGRLLGASVVLLALVILAIGSTTFLGGGAGGPPSTPTIPAVAVSPSPSLAPTPTPPPSPSPTPTPTESVAPSPTPFELVVQEGPGYVTFGTRYNNNLRIIDPATTFPVNKKVRWSAESAETVDTRDLLLRVYTFDPATDEEVLVLEEPVNPDVRGARIFLTSKNPRKDLAGEAIYVVRYFRGDEVLAEGYFEAVKS
jgi:hypothetical protein